jgi:hypothetical protein
MDIAGEWYVSFPSPRLFLVGRLLALDLLRGVIFCNILAARCENHRFNQIVQPSSELWQRLHNIVTLYPT